MTPKMLENCGEQVYITIGFNIDNVIFEWELSRASENRVCWVRRAEAEFFKWMN